MGVEIIRTSCNIIVSYACYNCILLRVLFNGFPLSGLQFFTPAATVREALYRIHISSAAPRDCVSKKR